jgi:hypothetical protein
VCAVALNGAANREKFLTAAAGAPTNFSKVQVRQLVEAAFLLTFLVQSFITVCGWFLNFHQNAASCLVMCPVPSEAL